MNINVKHCARCGGDHDLLLFEPLGGQPIEGITHWAECPVLNQPILMEVRQAGQAGIRWNGLPLGDFWATFWAYGKWHWADLRIENAMEVAQGNVREGWDTEADARTACRLFAALPREEQEKGFIWALKA